MIKCIIFDLDGVLVDAKEIHYESLNMALADVGADYVITREEHLSKYDGLPTKQKLKYLELDKGFPKSKTLQVFDMKQKYTVDVIKQKLSTDHLKVEYMRQLKEDGYTIYVASNSIRKTLQLMLHKTGIIEYVDFFFSNEDVRSSKPHPEIYTKCFLHGGFKPSECLIVEDSVHGRMAATESGGVLYPVKNDKDWSYESLKEFIQKMKQTTNQERYKAKDMNIVIPMAGKGSRFADVGYTFPKPLIEVNGKPMIQVVVENLNIDANYIFIVRDEHYEKYNLQYLLNLIAPDCTIVIESGELSGAAYTTLLAQEYIDNDKPLLLANSDQFIEWNSNDFMYKMESENYDGSILTFEATHPKWSFVKVDENDFVTEVAEKKPISNIANVGVYYWNRGSDYVKYAKQMIEKNIKLNNEFYVAPVYNEAILDDYKIKNYRIEKMWGIGTPEDLKYYLENYNG